MFHHLWLIYKNYYYCLTKQQKLKSFIPIKRVTPGSPISMFKNIGLLTHPITTCLKRFLEWERQTFTYSSSCKAVKYSNIFQVRAIYRVVEVRECLFLWYSSCTSVNKPWKWLTHSSIFCGSSLTAWLPLWSSPEFSLRWLSCKDTGLIPSLLKQQITDTHTHTRWICLWIKFSQSVPIAVHII